MKKDIKQTKYNSTTQPINIHEEYLQYHEKFIGKYGPKTIVLMQVGSFYECYSTETRGPNLFELSDVLNIICTRKDKSVTTIDEKNPYMLGFNCAATNKFLKLLVDNNYTVVTVDQVSPPPKPKRQTQKYIAEVYEYAKNQSKWEAAKDWCADRGYEFKIITESELGIK